MMSDEPETTAKNNASPYVDSSEPLKHLYIFLLAPTEKLFECIRLEVSDELGLNATVGSIVDLIPSKATEPTLVAQKLVGLCRRIEDAGTTSNRATNGSGTSVLTNRTQRASECIHNGELLIAIPDGFTAEHCQSLVKRILKKQPKIRKLLQRKGPLAPHRTPRNCAARPKTPSGSTSSKSVRSTGGMKRSSSVSSTTGLNVTLEAIEEGENESKASSVVTCNRDDENFESIDESTCKGLVDNTTTRISSVGTDLLIHFHSNPNNIDTKIEEDVTRREIQALIRRESDKKVIEEQVQQCIEARNKIRAEIESRVNDVRSDNAKEQLLDLDAANHIERLALEASELESSFISEASVWSEPPISPPKKRKRHQTKDVASKDENNLCAVFLPKIEHRVDKSTEVSAQKKMIIESYRRRSNAMKYRIKRAKTSVKQKLQLKAFPSTAVSALIVAFSSACYHMWNPNPIGLSSYIVFIIVFVTIIVLRRHKLSVARRRRRSRSLSTTPIRKGSIRRIQIAKSQRCT